MYISPHSAEAILSDFRPLKLQTDALTFLNLFLDDILANIIASARSLLTDRLKTGLLKSVPTTIGKDALLEAEMELRAYWQRPNAVKPSASQVSASEHNFFLPSMIELMRLKCEAYSTLNDLDEDAQAENGIQERLRSQGIDPPKSIIVAPAALYLTAILECICERTLSSVGRVATRDSSKDAAGTYDLFVALCEDDAIYPIFKGSKVYDAVESSLKQSAKPQRSKSFSRSERSENRDTDPSQSRSRLSAESATSGAISAVGSDNYPSRSSIEKGKPIKLFRPSSDRDAALSSDAVSRVTTSRKGLGSPSDSINESFVQDPEESNLMQDFDDLMRSGDTMKVSLTPDRLRSMETAKQQQQQRQLLTNPRRTGKTPPHEHSRTLSAADTNGRHGLSPGQQYHDSKKPLPSPYGHVDSIVEDEEPREGVVLPPPAVQSHSVTKPDARVRSVSASGISHGLGPQGPQVTRKPSLGGKNPPPSFRRMGGDSYNLPNNPSTSPRRKRKIRQNRESMDIDLIMNGSEEGSESSPDAGDQATQARARPYPVSKATKDLISFLEAGPPPDVQPAHTATVSSVSLTPTTKSAKSLSRLQRMISKLNLSKDDRMLQDSRGRRVDPASAPVTPVVSTVRSLGTNLPPLPPSVKPVPPPVLSIPPAVPLSLPLTSQPSLDDDDALSPASRNDRQPRKMSLRKAVPNWETADQGVLAARTRDTGVTSSLHTVHTSSPSIVSSTPPTQNGQAQSRLPSTPAPEAKKANGHTHDNHKLLGSDSSAEIPTPASVLETRSHSPAPRESENGRAEAPLPDLPQPRSSRPNRRSMNDEKVNPARRLSGRLPQPPVTPTPSMSESLALDLRKLMSQATTADECRLLLDTILTRAGITTPYSPVLDTTPTDIEPLEKVLVHHFLGAEPDESRTSHSQSMTTEAVQHPASDASGHPPVESNDLHQSTTTPTNHGNAVHSHHISTTVAVAS